MTHAYDEEYLDDAMENLGEAMDFAVHSCHLTMDEFMELFVASGLSAQFGAGVPNMVSGKSGTELVYDVMQKSGVDAGEDLAQEISGTLPALQIDYDCSPEYWCGWILAYYQWYTGRSFKNIMQQLPMETVARLYSTHHEAAEQKFVDTVNHIIQRKNPPTRLQELRKTCGYSQRELSDRSGVSLRSIQQYEQRVKDINKAAASNLLALAKVLGCKVEDLVEYDSEMD